MIIKRRQNFKENFSKAEIMGENHFVSSISENRIEKNFHVHNIIEKLIFDWFYNFDDGEGDDFHFFILLCFMLLLI